jgi:hypothetical protein
MNNKDFNQLTQSARDANLADYFLQSGYDTQRHGAELYIKELPGLCVNINTNKWYYHYEKIGGGNAVDCLVKVCGRDFKQAVYELAGRDICDNPSKCYPKKFQPQFTTPPQTIIAENIKKEMVMPDRAENMRRVFAYFCKERKIPAEIVEELAHAKLLYQSSERIETTVNGIKQISNPQNAVFVHTDESGNAIGGEVQGINSYKRYKGLVAGTGDSAFSYTPFPANDGKTKTAYLFESAIDLMSFYAFCKKTKMEGVTLISMAGLKPTIPKQLQEQGVNVISCVDNDDEGRKFEQKNNFKRSENKLLEKAGVKDWNDLLKMKTENPNSVKTFTPDSENKNIFMRRKK